MRGIPSSRAAANLTRETDVQAIRDFLAAIADLAGAVRRLTATVNQTTDTAREQLGFAQSDAPVIDVAPEANGHKRRVTAR